MSNAAKMHIEAQFPSKVRGVTYGNRQDIIRKYIKPGAYLLLKQDPDNEHDPNAIAVMFVNKRRLRSDELLCIGYIGRELAAELIGHMAKGKGISATVKEITGGTRDKPTLGVNLQIYILGK
jgi:hypothetical protein